MNDRFGRRVIGFLGVLLVGVVSFAWGCAEGAPDDAQAETTAAAQSGDMDAMKAMLIDGFERAKKWDMAIANAVPDGALDWSPGGDVRGFAAQIVHASNNGFIGDFMFGTAAPEMAVSEESVPDQASLVAAIGASYDWLIEQLNAMDASDLATEVGFIGGNEVPRWRIGVFALEHAMWTRGQTVPYFHANDAPVPDNALF